MSGSSSLHPDMITPTGDLSGNADLAQIQNSMNLANAYSGGIVRLASGIHWINESIQPVGNVRLIGSKGTIIKAVPGMSQHMLATTQLVNPPCAFESFILDGGNGSNPWASGGAQPNAFDCINFAAQVTRFVMTDITCQNISRDGINLSGGSQGGAEFTNIQVLFPQRYGVNNQGSDIRYEGVEVEASGQQAFYINAGTQVDFYNCKSNTSGMMGVTTVANPPSSGSTLNVANTLATSYPAANGILQIVHIATSTAYAVPYTSVTVVGGFITQFVGCTFGAYVPTFKDTVGLLQTATDGTGTADSWYINTPAVSVRAVAQNNLYGNALWLGGNNCQIQLQAGNAGNTLLVVNGALRNTVDMVMSKWFNFINPPNYVYAIDGNTHQGNKIAIEGAGIGLSPNPLYETAYALLKNGATHFNNQFELELENPKTTQNPAFTANFLPNPYLGGTIYVVLTGNITIQPTQDSLGNPLGHEGSEVVFILQQNGAGGHAVTWTSSYLNVFTTITPGGNSITKWRFKCLSILAGVPQWTQYE